MLELSKTFPTMASSTTQKNCFILESKTKVNHFQYSQPKSRNKTKKKHKKKRRSSAAKALRASTIQCWPCKPQRSAFHSNGKASKERPLWKFDSLGCQGNNTGWKLKTLAGNWTVPIGKMYNVYILKWWIFHCYDMSHILEKKAEHFYGLPLLPHHLPLIHIFLRLSIRYFCSSSGYPAPPSIHQPSHPWGVQHEAPQGLWQGITLEP